MTRLSNIYKYLLVIVVLAGCKKLDLAPKDQVSDASFWKKPQDFQLAANDFYKGLMEVPQYIDITSDIAFGGGANNVSNGTYLPAANSTSMTPNPREARQDEMESARRNDID